MQRFEFSQEKEEGQDGREALRNQRCPGGAGHTPLKDRDHKKIQRHIQDRGKDQEI